MQNCIARCNLKYYVLFLLYTLCAALLSVYEMCSFFIASKHVGHGAHRLQVGTQLFLAFVVPFAMAIDCAVLLGVGWLFVRQTWLLCADCTTLEWVTGQRKNLKCTYAYTNFCSVMGPPWMWLVPYNTRTSKTQHVDAP